MSKNIDETSFDGGKYTLQLNQKTGEFQVLRHGEPWVYKDVPMSKMLIGIMYEVSKMRKLLSDVINDFDPELKPGPPCGPGMLKRIQQYEEQFNVDLRYVKDINE